MREAPVLVKGSKESQTDVFKVLFLLDAKGHDIGLEFGTGHYLKF
jgi:hypothetical protein